MVGDFNRYRLCIPGNVDLHFDDEAGNREVRLCGSVRNRWAQHDLPTPLLELLPMEFNDLLEYRSVGEAVGEGFDFLSTNSIGIGEKRKLAEIDDLGRLFDQFRFATSPGDRRLLKS